MVVAPGMLAAGQLRSMVMSTQNGPATVSAVFDRYWMLSTFSSSFRAPNPFSDQRRA